MRVLFFHRWVGVRLGGTETHIKELAKRLQRRGHIVHILTLKGSKLDNLQSFIKVQKISPSYGEQLTSYEMKDPRLFLYTALYLFKSLLKLVMLKIQKRDYDIVSAHFVTEGLLLMLIARLFGWGYVYILDGYTDLEASVAKYADLQITISQTVANKCKAKYKYEPMVIPVGIDTSQFCPIGKKKDFGGTNGKKTVLSISRLVPEKNLDLLLRAAKIVCEKDENILFVIVGEGRERRNLEQLRDDLNLKDRVLFLGSVGDKELPEYYRSADMFAITQNAEDQFWITALEAMSSGLPIIASCEETSVEVLGDGGIVFPSGRSDILAVKILELANNYKLRQETATRLKKNVARYDWNKLITDYEKQFTLLCRCKRR